MAKDKLSKDSREKFKAARDYIKIRDVESARSQLLAIELGSSLTLFHRMMAACAYIEKEYDLAASHIEQSMALDPNKQVLIADAIRIYRSKRDEKRTSSLLDQFNLDNTESSAELMRIALSMKMYQRFDDAVIALEKALRLSPENVRARNLYGIVLCCMNRYDDALQQWTFSLRYNPNEVVTKVCLGRLCLHQQNYLKAIDYFKQTLGTDKDNLAGRKLNLAEAYVRASSLSEARDLLSEIQGAEDNPRLHYTWSLLHSVANDHFLAFSSLDRCITLGREHAHPNLQSLNWDSHYHNEEVARNAITSALPVLNSIFDSLSLLKSLNHDAQSRPDDITDSISDII